MQIWTNDTYRGNVRVQKTLLTYTTQDKINVEALVAIAFYNQRVGKRPLWRG